MVATERRHRVSITYLDEDGRRIELPFVLGVIGPFRGDGAGDTGRRAFRERRFVEVDASTIGEVMKRMGPALRIRVPNYLQCASLSGNADAAVDKSAEPDLVLEIQFRELGDFEPQAVARNVASLRRYVAERSVARRATDLIGRGVDVVRAVDEAWRWVAAAGSITLPEDGAWADTRRRAWVAELEAVEPSDPSLGNRCSPESGRRDDARCRMHRVVAILERVIQRQLNAILHHPQFQRLESAWRGVYQLCESVSRARTPSVEVRIMHVTWRELEKDFESAVDFDQSAFYRKVIEGLDLPNGKPFGALLADFAIGGESSSYEPKLDIPMIRNLAQVGAAAFCPIFLGTHPSLLGLKRFDELERPSDFAKFFSGREQLSWRDLRKREDCRFIGLVLPRIAMREPYRVDRDRSNGFRFEEDTTAEDGSGVLWGSPIYAVGGVLIREFARSGWLASIRGIQPGEHGVSGLVDDARAISAATDRSGLVPLPPVEFLVTDELERRLADVGFITLCPCAETSYAAFYSFPSLHEARTYFDPRATASATMERMLHYTLCASRFAHYIKAIGLRKTGSVSSASELETLLHNWLFDNYVTTDRDASLASKAKRPLFNAQVQVKTKSGHPGAYDCVIQLQPHFELDDLETAIRLETVIGR